MSSKNASSLNAVWSSITSFLRDRFNLDDDKAHEQDTIEEIRKAVIFRGTNLWILMFAILVASVGLNVNSTAVIIGAMLISPLMGPIMGVGLGIGINDIDLILKALKNLGVAAGISVLTSALYFSISPLHEAQSELLARVSPTTWDVLIAFFGGLAGIVAGSRKEKSNAIPGVAIATALMPPLCTAGYGLATSQWSFFFGAFYLFFINSVFISLATYLIVRFLGFKKKQFELPEREKRVKRFIAIFVILTIIPSIYTAYRVVQKSFFERDATNFVNNEMNFENCKVIGRHFEFDPDRSIIEVTLYGEKVPKEKIDEIRAQMPSYNLNDAQLIVNQGYNGGLDVTDLEKLNQQLKTGIIEDLYSKNEALLQSKDETIKLLETELLKLKTLELPSADITREAKAMNTALEKLSLSRAIITETDSLKQDTILLVYADFKSKPPKSEISRLENWLKVRTKMEKIKLVVE